jgi:hypothetical protein
MAISKADRKIGSKKGGVKVRGKGPLKVTAD